MPFRTLAGKRKKEEKPRENISEIVFELIKNRRSVRKYKSKPVPNEILTKIMLSASYAPSAGNHQPWEFIIVRNEEKRRLITEACFGQDWMIEAPVFIVACINMRLARAIYGERGERLYGIQAVAAAIENMLIYAESLGLGTCWVGAFSEPKVTALLETPYYVRPAAIITLGYPAEKPEAPHREPLSEYVHFEKFNI